MSDRAHLKVKALGRSVRILVQLYPDASKVACFPCLKLVFRMEDHLLGQEPPQKVFFRDELTVPAGSIKMNQVMGRQELERLLER